MAAPEEDAQYDDYQEEGEPPVDASKYLGEMRKEALQVLFPHPKEQSERMSLITILRGRSPDILSLYLAAVEWEGWLAVEEHRPFDWKALDPIEFLKSHAPSIQGKRAGQAVEIARATQAPEHKKSLADLLRGK